MVLQTGACIHMGKLIGKLHVAAERDGLVNAWYVFAGS